MIVRSLEDGNPFLNIIKSTYHVKHEKPPKLHSTFSPVTYSIDTVKLYVDEMR